MDQLFDHNTKREIRRQIDAMEDGIDALIKLDQSFETLRTNPLLGMGAPHIFQSWSNIMQMLQADRKYPGTIRGWLHETANSLEKELGKF